MTGCRAQPTSWSLTNTNTQYPYYALSEVFTVGGSTPVFTESDPTSRSVPENSRAFTNVGDLVAATDADLGDTLTYSLGGTDAASFNIGTTSGRILTKAGVSYDHETKSRYSVEVTVTDGTYSATITVNITVTDVAEPPSAAPGAPTVSAVTSPDRLYVTWTAPANTSHPINDYDVQYRTDGSGNWQEWPHTGTRLAATILGLAAGTAYEVQVRAGNVEGVTAWSGSGRATTGTMTTVPGNWELKPSGLVAGNEFRILFLTHRTFSPTSSDIADYNAYVQAEVRRGHTAIRPYDSGFRVVGSSGDDAARDNTATTYTATAKGLPIYWLNGSKVADDYEDFYDGTWDDEANPRFRDGTVRFPNDGQVWTGSNNNGTANSSALGDSSVMIGRLNGTGGPLNANATYSGVSIINAGLPYYALSEVFGVGTANNNVPVFSDTAPASRSIAENTGPGADVGAPVAATDADTATTGELLTYSLGGTDAASFTIDPTSGQIRTRSGVSYNFEAKSGYSVTVRATDGTHTTTNTATIAVTITLTDVNEPPGVLAAPRVREVAGMTDRLNVSWTAPANTGPPITDYDVRYRVGTSGTWTDLFHTGTGRTLTILALAAATLFDVQMQVRATNAEGTGDWSEAGSAPRAICGRTSRVVEAILAATPARDSCDTILPRDMAALTELDIPSRPGSFSLTVDDFAGLGGLTQLDLSDTFLQSLPSGAFDDLDSLTQLDLSDTSLQSLPSGAFDGLESLVTLDLSDTSLQSLSSGVFADLDSLITLDLSDNWLLQTSAWPVGAFDGLDSLQVLRIANVGYEGRGIQFVNTDRFEDFFAGLGNLRVLDVRPATPLLGVPLALLPLTSLLTYNGAPYTRPVDPPRNLRATMSDIDTSIMVDEQAITGFETVVFSGNRRRQVPIIEKTGRSTRFCKTVRLTWAAPTGVGGITGYRILRTHHGHPVVVKTQHRPSSHGAFGTPTDYSRYAYEITTVGHGATGYTHTPLRPGPSGHKFTYYVAAITADGDGFPAKVNVEADVLIPWSSGGATTEALNSRSCS